MQRHDERLGRFLKALEDTGDMEKTTVVVLGDHCQVATHTAVFPNYYLKQAGLLRLSDDGKVAEYDFYTQHCDGSCYIYPSKKTAKMLKTGDGEQREELMKCLRAALKQIPQEMISRIITHKEAGQLGADKNCVCMLEAQPGYYFQNGFETPYEKVENMTEHAMYATHGYLPDLPEYETFFMMSGYGVAEGNVAAEMCLWDEGPTLATILGVSLGETDGKVKKELLKEKGQL